MTEVIAIVALMLLWSIATSLKRIALTIRHFRLEVTIPIHGDDGGGETKPAPAANVIAFRRRT